MGTALAAPGWLLLVLAVLAGTAGLCRAVFSLPLRVSHPAAPAAPPPAPVLLRPASSSPQQDAPGAADGLALASDPGGTLNFLAMVENLQGDSGRGYYLEMLIGTPPQAVGAAGAAGWGGMGMEGPNLCWVALPSPRLQRNFVPVLGAANSSLPFSPPPSLPGDFIRAARRGERRGASPHVLPLLREIRGSAPQACF